MQNKSLIEEGFNRRYVLLPLILSVALVLLGYTVTETRRTQTKNMSETIRTRQDVMRVLAETIYTALESESAQRGFLLTGEQKYLTPFETGENKVNVQLDELISRYRLLAPEEIRTLNDVRGAVTENYLQMQASIDMLRAGDAKRALALVKSDIGLHQMHSILEMLEGLRNRERSRIYDDLSEWNGAVRLNTIINACSTAFTLILLFILGLLATRDLRRREAYAAELTAQVNATTADLKDLSQHMSRVVETEKHALARELHDELGGLLVAMRMDISQIKRRLGASTDPDLIARWARVDQALATGIELKRRVIEELRPTLLDNLGLIAALRWQAEQSCEQARLSLVIHCDNEEIELPPDTAIAVFRTCQEALTNIVKHANAKSVEIDITSADLLEIRIADDGAGFTNDARQLPGSHGLKQMRFRMEGVGGQVSFERNQPTGTIVTVSVALVSDTV